MLTARVGAFALLLIAWVFDPPVADAQETLLCVADAATGYKWDGKDWQSVNFNVSDEKYAVKPSQRQRSPADGMDYDVVRLGDNYSSAPCWREKFKNGNYMGQVACGGLGIGFIVNFTTLRFQHVYGHGFVGGADDGKDSPYIAIGKCVKM
ncbi:hypothetical protein [Aestuariivirga sp.]|uniref:hypothetical protein n=1 Tax=Aestuariivirga sp. TaxID=2650926 RepID=UPI0039E662F6